MINNEKNKFIYKKNLILFSTLFLGTILWFFKFPTYRYGSSYLIGSIIFSQFYLFKYLKINKNLNKILKILIFSTLAIVFVKYLTKYESSKNIWPNIYSFETNV